MPTAKPRITITLSDEQHATLQALSEVQGVSMSSIVVDLLETTLPVLQRLTTVLQNASNAPQAVLDSLRGSLDSAMGDVQGHGAEVMSQLDVLVRLSGSGDGAAAPSPEPGPPTSNRGVRIDPPSVKNPSKSRPSSNSKGGKRK